MADQKADVQMAQEDPKRYQFQATDNVGAVKQFTDYQFLDAKDPLQ
jgi:hypothetical protein